MNKNKQRKWYIIILKFVTFGLVIGWSISLSAMMLGYYGYNLWSISSFVIAPFAVLYLTIKVRNMQRK